MKCNFFDIACHAQNAAQGAAWQVQSAVYEWWVSVGLLNKALILVGLWFAALYLTRGIGALAGRLGGWKAVAGYAVVVFGAVLWLFLKFQPKKPDDFTGEVEGRDASRPFRVPPPRRKPRGKRRYDADTNSWVDITP